VIDAPPGERRPIQIWMPTEHGWRRPPAGPLGDHHASTEFLRPKEADGLPRVVLVGESVATGYLHAPAHTPARVLAALLPGHDVIDLAKVNEGLADLVDTVRAAVQLEPDVVVVWAGNNWMLRDLVGLSPYHGDATHRVELADALIEAGTEGAAALTQHALDAVARPLLEELHGLSAAAGFRLVIVVPEVDLDWPVEQPWTWFDDITSTVDPVPTRAYTQASARATIERAAGPLRGSITPPMATSAIQDLLRSWAERHGHPTVDVPALVASDPDRHWFLDYCHHSADGLESVVRAVATRIEPEAATRPAPQPTAHTLGVAALGAAVHTAHTMVAIDAATLRRRRIRELVEFARRTWPEVDRSIRDLITMRLSAAPPILHPATARLADAGFGFAHGIRPVGLDAVVLSCLDAAVTSEAWSARGDDRRPAIELWSPGGECWIHERHRRGAAAAEGPVLFRSIRSTTRLVLPPGDADHRVELTLRLPEPGRVAVEFPGGATITDVADTWTRIRLEVLADGRLRPRPLRIVWPAPVHTNERRNDVLDALRCNEPAAIHPIFGELLAVRIDTV